MLKTINSYLNKLARTEVHLLRRRWSVFKLCAYIGLVLAIVTAMMLVSYVSLSHWVIAVLVFSSVTAYFILRMVTQAIIGRDSLTYYHHMIAIILMATVVLWLLRQPVLPYLDVTIVGLGIILFCGRLGCLMVGCCHGRPHRWGGCRREEDAAAGFTPYFAGVRLFPIQAVESLWVFSLVIVGIVLILGEHPPGETLAWYVITYAIGRFCFEFMRGDAVRPYLWGFSEAQWTSLVLMCVIVGAELSGILNFHLWHAGAAACLVFAIIAVALVRLFRRTAKHLLLHPRHVNEVAQALEWVANLTTETPAISEQNFAPAAIKIGCTSLGIQISASQIEGATGCTYHYALSHQNGVMDEATARTVARLIRQLRHSSNSNEFIQGNRGVFHLVIPHPTEH
jgi:prolipoprotein diacylglyceryltransferase